MQFIRLFAKTKTTPANQKIFYASLSLIKVFSVRFVCEITVDIQAVYAV
jgi:hypothetical protein